MSLPHLQSHDSLKPQSAAAGPAATSPAGETLEEALPVLRERLLRHARFAVHDRGLAEDLVQETLIAVLERHAQRRGEATLLTWSTAILRNKVADWYRSPNRQRMVQMTADEGTLDESIDALYSANGSYAEPVPAWQQPENHTEQRQMMTALERCLGRLPRQTGRVFMMREWLGFETAEICERVGVSAENCRTILHRARMGLRTCMQRDWIAGKAAQ